METQRPGSLMASTAVERLHGHRGPIFNRKTVDADFDLNLVEDGSDGGVVGNIDESSARRSLEARSHFANCRNPK